MTESNSQYIIPLKDRKDEILLLAMRFVQLSREQLGTKTVELSKEAEEFLLTYEWSDEGELEIVVKRACILSEGPVLRAEDFDLKQRQMRSIGRFVESKLKGFMHNIKGFETFNLYDMVIPEVERSLIIMVMKETKGNQVKAAKLLGINRNTLRSKIRKLGIKIKTK
jgi:DNA-binding NtrC family response regulator